MDVLIAWLHYVGFVVMFAALVAQHLLFDDIAPEPLARRLAILDAIYGASLLLVFATGVFKVLLSAQGAEGYLENWVYQAKILVFFLVVLVSAWPTIHFLRGRRKLREGAAQVTYPRLLQVAFRVEISGMLVVLLLAAMLGQGVGYAGG